jgi:exopolysaccharide biosynthesis protein
MEKATNSTDKQKKIPVFLLVLIDIILIGISLCIFALFHHVIPSRQIKVITKNIETSALTSDWGDKFSGKFTDGEIIQTDNSYQSENIGVTLTSVQENGITYYIEDIYIRNIENLRAAFAQDTFGKSIRDWTWDIAADHNAIAAINGDNYGLGSSNGAVIRDGILYRDDADGDVILLNYDGTMEIVSEEEYDGAALIEAGAYQAWDFGPSLLVDGESAEEFESRINQKNPRTAIGYFEPGHYCFVVVDGRQKDYSNGMTMAELSVLFKSLGCSIAYNLDGGKTSVMTFNGETANQPFAGGRQSTDIIYIAEFETGITTGEETIDEEAEK